MATTPLPTGEMEILGEILIAVAQLLGELLLRLLAEALAELGLETIREAIRPSNRPGLSSPRSATFFWAHYSLFSRYGHFHTALRIILGCGSPTSSSLRP